MISRVAVVPQPPLLVPELVGGPDEDAERLRAACRDAAAALLASSDHWVAVGAHTRPAHHPPATTGTFAPYGADVPVSLQRVNPAQDRRPPAADLPLPVLVAGWLRGQVDAADVPVHLVAQDATPADCARDGARLAAELSGPDPVALLVVGDGSHRHGEHAVGRPDERAPAFDDAVARALATADLAALAGLDPAVAADLGAAGRAPWQVLAAALRADGRTWRGTRSTALVPFGVAYHVAVWDPA
ncbi:class III extradiol ring-cleavage dioxygenase family protein [Actinokineospora bangkokensis]|uniref:Extradiol ring-cleavage dioxygenase class III enzyme subunit B domain-containing protein n=1 Tax=Actinokineospora bangkokensis TaxID=1193682 RepID=A0A1Q9LT30_9PSEU|nr:hypothetical protein [Actinokineospora bangkokensis]OLR95202.1 hypothetical protein BJP25_07875 [Actinokineospora bangkokensis]